MNPTKWHVGGAAWQAAAQLCGKTEMMAIEHLSRKESTTAGSIFYKKGALICIGEEGVQKMSGVPEKSV